MPPWPAAEVGRTTWRTPITVGAAVGTLTDFPALFAQPYATLFGAGVTPPQNSLSIYDYDGNLLPFGVRRYDGTTCFMDWQDDFAGVDKQVFLYFHPTVDPGSSNANPTGVYDAATKGVWHMEDGGPTNVLDATANANNGVQSGGVTFGAAGQVGKCCSFDGYDDEVAVGSNLLGGGSISALSWSGWVYIDAIGTTRIFYDVGNQAFTVLVHSGGTFRCVVNAGAYVTSAQTLSAGQWYHLAVVYNASKVQFYVNGVAGSLIDAPASFTDGAHAIAGYAGLARHIGDLDEVRLHTGIRATSWFLAENLFGLGTAVTIGAVEEYQAGASVPLLEQYYRRLRSL